MINEKTTIIGHYLGTVEDLVKPFIKLGGDINRARRLASIYLKYDRKFNIKADIAFAQMCHETALLKFTGIAQPEWNNFAGIGITGPGAKQTFVTEELGVLAQFVHLCWYVYPDHVNSLCSRVYDPRHFEEAGKHHPKYTGDITIKRLGGAWAFPGDEYAAKISKYANIINGNSTTTLIDVVEEPTINVGNTTIKDGKLDICIQMGHVGITKGMTGTAGEREWTKKVGDAMEPLLKASGLNYKIIPGIKPLPTDPVINCKVFLALHCDGSTDPKAHGYTLGFKPTTNEAFKNALSDSYGKLTGFFKRQENSTGGLRLYYMWSCKKEYAGSIYTVPPINADYYALLEHGFFTNPTERKWLDSNINTVAKHHVDLIVKFLKG